MPLPIGEIVGDYEIMGVIGQGGMGSVYKVRNVISDRIEAMKVLLPNLQEQPALIDRFLREIKVLAKLDHPNITALRTAFRAKDQLWMVMELVEGAGVDYMLRNRRPTVEDSVRYTVQALDALSYAHQLGVIHRDLKPANMILTPKAVLKITDFGIAHDAGATRLTATGVTLGSLPYMSPEQIQRGEVDSRSDIYALGITLYELLTGELPFSATTEFAIMSAHVIQPPRPPIEVNPEIPRHLSDSILRSLAKSPADRFQTAAEFRDALLSPPAATTRISLTPPAQLAATPIPTPPPLPHQRMPTVPMPTVPIPTAPIAIPTQAQTPPAARKSSVGKWAALAAAAVAAVAAAVLFIPRKPQEEATRPTPPVVQPAETKADPPSTPVASDAVTSPITPSATTTAPTTTAATESPAKPATEPPPLKSKEPAPPKPEPAVEVKTPAKDPVQQAWQSLATSRDVNALKAFRERNSGSPYAQLALQRIQLVLWEAARDSRDPARLRLYQTNHPNSPYAPLAAGLTEKLENAAASRGVLEALDRLAAAYGSRDLTKLREIWPSVSGPRLNNIRNMFERSKSIDVKFEAAAEPQVAGDTAIVPVRQKRVIQARNDEYYNFSDETTITLRKAGSSWVIQTFPADRDGSNRKKK